MKIEQKVFGKIGTETVHSYKITNKNGIEITCINYGGRITSIKTPDQNGNFENIVLGYDTLEGYVHDTSYQGALCGRVAGRIKDASFQLDGATYELTRNDGNNSLHGGAHNFSHVIWNAETFEKEEGRGVVFTYFSKDGEEGYPGNVELKVTYLLNDANEFTISYEGVPDKKTLLNMTNHSYFNLSGNTKETILNHNLTIKADKFAQLSEDLLPTGQLLNVEGTPFDLKNTVKLEEVFLKEDEQLALGLQGFDHPFLLETHFGNEIVLEDLTNGRKLIVETDQPAVVVYTGNQLTEEIALSGRNAEKYLGICLETQGLPDAINHEDFPQVTVDKDELYQAKTKYTFQVITN